MSSPHPRSSASADDAALANKARALYALRRRRNRTFADMDGLFAEPAWDILLDLFVRQQDGRGTPVTSLCQASAAPPTTALRWIAVLERRGLIAKSPDPVDRRQSNVRLSALGIARMRACLAEN